MVKLPLDQIVLLSVLEDQVYFSNPQYCSGVYRNRSGYLKMERHQRAVEDGMIQYKPADWIEGPMVDRLRRKFRQVVDALEDEGLITTERSSANGRILWLSLTPEGTKEAKEIDQRVQRERAKVENHAT